MPRISIVVAYFNRQGLLDSTLESIHASEVKDYELIIVDDASDIPVVCDEAKIIRIEKKDKWWHNPCVPYNMGFKAATGDIVVIQNPECYHVGDVLAFVRDNAKLNRYLSFSCYALNRNDTWQLHHGEFPVIKDRVYKHPENNGWYNHPIHRPVMFHFCSAIMRDDLMQLRGFDERYAEGIGYDDDDFAARIKKRKMMLNIVEEPYVLHQFHEPMSYRVADMRILHQRNRNLFRSLWQR
jgi:glycosyltransferase involved in cell wall biosynthesis